MIQLFSLRLDRLAATGGLLDVIQVGQLRQDAAFNHRFIQVCIDRAEVDEHVFLEQRQYHRMGIDIGIEFTPGIVKRRNNDVGAERVLVVADLVAAEDMGRAHAHRRQLFGMLGFERAGHVAQQELLVHVGIRHQRQLVVVFVARREGGGFQQFDLFPQRPLYRGSGREVIGVDIAFEQVGRIECQACLLGVGADVGDLHQRRDQAFGKIIDLRIDRFRHDRDHAGQGAHCRGCLAGFGALVALSDVDSSHDLPVNPFFSVVEWSASVLCQPF